MLFFEITFAQNTVDGAPVPQIIEKPDSISNYEALLKSNTLLFLPHTDPNYDRKAPGFWKKVDTTIVNRRKMRIIRTGGCKDSTVLPIKIENCTEHQYHTINVFSNKVLRYTAEGATHSVLVEFMYNKKRELVLYTENGAPSKLEYDESGELIVVYRFELVSGDPILKSIYNFKTIDQD